MFFLANPVKLDDSLTNETPNFSYLFRFLEEGLADPWNYELEFFFILVVGIFSIPVNFMLILFYAKKVRDYKKGCHLNPKKFPSANSFYTYLIEMSVFDTLLVIYLILDTTFRFLSKKKKTEYESVYDISNFTCKFFIYVVRISSAMSNLLLALLSINRCMLLSRFKKYRLCFNTKYLTLFVFCICTIANVFRLERLRLNLKEKQEEIPMKMKFFVIICFLLLTVMPCI